MPEYRVPDMFLRTIRGMKQTHHTQLIQYLPTYSILDDSLGADSEISQTQGPQNLSKNGLLNPDLGELRSLFGLLSGEYVPPIENQRRLG